MFNLLTLMIREAFLEVIRIQLHFVEKLREYKKCLLNYSLLLSIVFDIHSFAAEIEANVSG